VDAPDMECEERPVLANMSTNFWLPEKEGKFLIIHQFVKDVAYQWS
jgi:hypothetical protein